ncbi:hypothetical protein HYQ46_010134 [Verticillium longisporum]|nr:hypothetical protein HYQ46_010134 [Verticillium longisporum]
MSASPWTLATNASASWLSSVSLWALPSWGHPSTRSKTDKIIKTFASCVTSSWVAASSWSFSTRSHCTSFGGTRRA